MPYPTISELINRRQLFGNGTEEMPPQQMRSRPIPKNINNVTPIEDIIGEENARMVERKIRVTQLPQEVYNGGVPPENLPYPIPRTPLPYDNSPYNTPYDNRMQIPEKELTCRNIYNHIKECDICGKLYNNDKTIYIIIIAILAFICIILAKKVMNL